jgi:hypothetical protein
MGASFEHDPETLNKMHAAAIQCLANAQDLTLEECVGKAVTLCPKNTAALSQTIQVNHPVIEGDNIINGSFGPQGPNSGYAAAVENGSKPHFPPVAAIQKWVHLKQIAGTYSVKSGKRTGAKMSQERQDRAAAFLIARAISKRGTRPQPFLIPAWQQCKGNITKWIVKELRALRIK